MAKDNKGKKSSEESPNIDNLMKNLPKEVQEKLKNISSKVESFKKKVLEKFEDYIMGVALVPPEKSGSGESSENKKDKDVHVLVLVDDSDSKKMSKKELKEKLSAIINSFAKEIDPIIKPETLILSELWQNCLDGRYEILKRIALSVPIYDKGMLSAIKIAEVHKTMVLKKFERYIVSYVLAGSLVKGRATKESDIDVWIVIDDTDVKRMSRAELKDKLRAIIIGMGIEAGELTGIKNKLNIQVYILTDFWDSLREANPIIFTLLRDGIPFYDRGLFVPWKHLLKMGRIKPSKEAIDLFMSTGEQMLKRVEFKLKDIGIEDIYYAILTPSQAALMLYGVPPPDPKETPELMREIFVKKEHLLEEKFVKILEENIKVRKDIEHGVKKTLSGKELDKLLENANKYLKRIKRLFSQIQKSKEEENVIKAYDTVVSVVRDCLKGEGVVKCDESNLVNCFKENLIDSGKIPAQFLRKLKNIVKLKKDYDEKKLSSVDVAKMFKEANDFVKFVIEYMQRKRFRELESAKIRVKHGKDEIAEVLFTEKSVFIIYNIKKRNKFLKAKILESGGFGSVSEVSKEDFNKGVDSEKPGRVVINDKVFESLKKVFGDNIGVMFNY